MLARHELTLPQFDILATLRFSEGVTQQELAERLLVTKGNVCGILDRLEGIGWVERRPDAKDRRVNRLHLTGVGRAKVDSVFPDHNDVVMHTMRTLSAGDVRLLRGLLEQLERADNEMV
ncbi:MAG TPA: MarR family transcriptional regulator [Candidatus Sulfotelmatobacter sp.]|nr:MarR family transcriptional regulator [Candidatus Sulfotelmatobacter sp.]